MPALPAPMTHTVARPVHGPAVIAPSTLAVPVDASFATLGAALEAVRTDDVIGRAAGALRVGDVAQRLVFGPQLIAEDPGRELVFALVWRFDDGHEATLTWNVRVDIGPVLTSTRRWSAGDQASCDRIMDSWAYFAQLAERLARGTVAAARRRAEAIEEAGEAAQQPVPRRLPARHPDSVGAVALAA
jgi:hypothetical protein